MKPFFDPIVAEVRSTRERLQDYYGGWEGYHKHLEENRPNLEADGWRFETPEERATRLSQHKAVF